MAKLTLTIYEIETNSITFGFEYSGPSDPSNIEVDVDLYEDNEKIDGFTYSSFVDAGDSFGETGWFYDLSENTSYTIKAIAYWVDSNDERHQSAKASKDVTTERSRPSYFYWDTEKIKDKPFDVTAKEWNALIRNVKQVYIYQNNKTYTNSIKTAVKNQPFTAEHYNDIAGLINLIAKTSIRTNYVEGDPITATALNLLMETINDVE